MPKSELSRRVKAASSQPPLCEASAEDLIELDELLTATRALDELPGKWQAAILAAELGVEGHHCH